MEIRELSSLIDLKSCEHIQREVWGFGELEVVPVSQLKASLHAGGVVLGAFGNGEMIGFAYGFPALKGGSGASGPGLHSHMAAVLPTYQGRGVGRALKWAQRDWCLGQGIGWITWTFDPLRAGNARFNLEYLGVVCDHYLENLYGELTGPLNRGLASDRLIAFWELTSPRVRELLAGRSTPPRDLSALPRALRASTSGAPLLHPGHHSGDHYPSDEFLVAVPPDLDRLLKRDPDLAAAWQGQVRRVLMSSFACGFRAERFVEGSYLLVRSSADRGDRI